MSFDFSTPTTPTGLVTPGGDGSVKKYYRKAAHRFVDFFLKFFLLWKFEVFVSHVNFDFWDHGF